jgi:NTE family protein
MDTRTSAGQLDGEKSEEFHWRPERCGQIALVFQGGGALGAYQAGVYEALHEENIEPDWVTGVSIGAVNAAIIAGNPRDRRLDQLRTFWNRITERNVWPYTPDGDIFRKARNLTSALLTTTLGVPGFLKPHLVNPWFAPTGASTATSFYDSAPLAETLKELVDFLFINDCKLRFAVGAVNVPTGNFVYFDNHDGAIGLEHVMASAALPPAMPMVKIGTDYFWDGGIVSNTPLQHLLDHDDHLNTLVFQVDLFSARGQMPRDIEDVLGRHKDIMYSSRTRYNTDVHRRLREWKMHTYEALAKVPDDLLSERQKKLRDELAELPEITILHLIYQQKAYEGHSRDYDFSSASMREHWQSGYEDTKHTLMHKTWMEMSDRGIRVHDAHREEDKASSS